jgi:hypothetical protein
VKTSEDEPAPKPTPTKRKGSKKEAPKDKKAKVETNLVVDRLQRYLWTKQAVSF